jgi:2-oxoglutarate dehydrogenase E1 component
VIFTPKSLLRAPACTSPLAAFSKGQFEEVIIESRSAKRVILCSGKVYYDLMAHPKHEMAAIVRLEQLYPLNLDLLKGLKYAEWVWLQEEPQNMGAWNYIHALLPQLVYVGRAANATTATGSAKKHKLEQAALLEQAFGAI